MNSNFENIRTARAESALPAARPNLLVLMADQLRHDWLGAAGTAGVSTPNIDGLIGRGRWLRTACTNSAICVPARMSLATGRSPERIEAFGNEAMLPIGAATHYQHLRDHDYRVGIVGKLDLAKSLVDNGAGDRPAVFRWGFTHPLEIEGKMHAGSPYLGRPLGPYGHWLQERSLFSTFSADYARRFSQIRLALVPDHSEQTPSVPPYPDDELYRDSVLPTDAFADHWAGQRAVDWIRQIPADYPWHLFVSFPGPHDPFDPPTEWAERFREAPVPDPIPAGSPGKPGHVEDSPWQIYSEPAAPARRQYTAALALIDDQIGQILAALRERGFDENTIVVVVSDHGEMLGDHGLYQKSVPYEAAMRVPLVFAGPGIEPGVSDALIELSDLGPTLVELAGLPPQPDLDARSFAPLLTGQGEDRHRWVAVCSQRPYIAIRSATHKYINNTGEHRLSRPDDLDEVYDLAVDPDELNNLFLTDADAAAAIRDELIALARAEGHELARLTPRPVAV